MMRFCVIHKLLRAAVTSLQNLNVHDGEYVHGGSSLSEMWDVVKLLDESEDEPMLRPLFLFWNVETFAYMAIRNE